MTKEEMIELARQAGFLTNEIKSYVISPYTSEDQDLYQELEAFAKLVADHEREACAKLCESYFERVMASRIRARGEA